ncbi:unnamed protein product [Prunus armeniaca]
MERRFPSFRHVIACANVQSDRSVSAESHALSFHTRWSPPCSFFKTKAEPYPRTPASWPDPDGFLPPAVQQLSFVLERRRGPKPWCGQDFFPALGENDLPSYEAAERPQCDR